MTLVEKRYYCEDISYELHKVPYATVNCMDGDFISDLWIIYANYTDDSRVFVF